MNEDGTLGLPGSAAAAAAVRAAAAAAPSPARSEEERRVAFGRCREDVALPVELGRPVDVLQPDPSRSDESRDRVPGRCAVLQDDGRRQDVEHRAGNPAQRSSRDLDRSEGRQSHADRQRRRDRRHLRPGGHVGVRQHGAGRPVLRGQRRHAEAVLRLRRPAGQRQLVRTERDEQRQRHPQFRLVPGRRRRRLLHRERQSDWTILYSESQDGATSRVDLRTGRSNSIRPRGPAPAAARQRRPAKTPEPAARRPAQFGVRRQSERQHRAHAAGGNVLPVLLEYAIHPLAAQPAHDLSRRRAAVPFLRSRRHLDGVARLDEKHRPERSTDLGVAGNAPMASKHDGAASFSNIVTIGESPLVPGHHLGRHQRRQPADEPRRRQHLEERRRQGARACPRKRTCRASSRRSTMRARVT